MTLLSVVPKPFLRLDHDRKDGYSLCSSDNSVKHIPLGKQYCGLEIMQGERTSTRA